jgi:hypothetical protein
MAKRLRLQTLPEWQSEWAAERSQALEKYARGLFTGPRRRETGKTRPLGQAQEKKEKPGTTAQTWNRAQKLIAELFRRAMRDSDFLMKEILERIDGKLAADTGKERLGDRPPTLVVLDMPRPKRPSQLPPEEE